MGEMMLDTAGNRIYREPMMEESSGTKPLNIYQRMHKVMADVSYVQKEDKKVNNQYTFVSHDAVTAKLRPAFLKHGILAIPSVESMNQDGNRTEVTLAVRFINIDDPEDHIWIEAIGFGIDPQDKGPGKAVSYAFKYALLKAFCLETGDDPEKDQIPHEPKIGDNLTVTPKAGVSESLTPAQRKKVDRSGSAIVDMVLAEDYDAAFAEIEACEFEPEEKVYLASFMTAAQRRKVKEAGEKYRKSNPLNA